MKIKLINVSLVALAAVLVAAALPAAPVQAANMAAVTAFQATCTSFSVDVTVTGMTNDQAGFDRFRYQVTDALGNVLYAEDSARQVNATERSLVIGLPYQGGAAPQADPVRLSIIDLDMLGRPVSAQQVAVANGACLSTRARETSLAKLLTTGVVGALNAETTLFTAPNGDALDIRVEKGREFTAVYRSVDNAWVALYVGGENLVWVPARSIDVNLGSLNVQPQRIDQSQQVTGAVLPGFPVSTARARFRVNFRLGPSIFAQRIGSIPWRAEVPVYGRSFDGEWLLIEYNGLGGWVAARYFTLIEVPLSRLPIVG
ncbi:MAG: SH3 domain-containing protein [Anaerolineae bacterium]|nr:SH3 domain-containing protein [Anaerolineae bacterium]